MTTCSACGKAYALPGTASWFVVCPHCAASRRGRPLRIRGNANAAVLAVVALVTVVCGMLLPFMSMSQLGVVREFSLVGGIVELARRGHGFLAALLFAFSVVFPIAKLVFILVATSSLVRLSMATRRKLKAVAVATGKYSLLDVLVIAIMIVLIKFDGLADVSARAGTVVFCVAILLSMLAGVCVDLGDTEKGDGGH